MITSSHCATSTDVQMRQEVCPPGHDHKLARASEGKVVPLWHANDMAQKQSGINSETKTGAWLGERRSIQITR